MYPLIEIKKDKIMENVRTIKGICDERGIKLSVVTKLLADNKAIVSEIVAAGVSCICESRIQNLISYKDIDVEKWLIRLPMLSEVPDVVRYSTASLNSEIAVIKALDEESGKQGVRHKVILMYELGDLREGLMKDDLYDCIAGCLKLRNIELHGIGVNLSCYGEILPGAENMNELNELVNDIESHFGISLPVVSGGNSSSYDLMKHGLLPDRINNLRFGESVFLGNLPCFEVPIPELNHGSFVLKAEIIELREKPSIPWGESGMVNSFGEESSFVDRGIRKRAIIALGKQDVNVNGMFPVDDKIIVLGGSSDHIILDVTDSQVEYKVGDIVDFNLNYSAILTLMTSSYINRRIV